MRNSLLSLFSAAILALGGLCASARTYVVERGDTWEIIARKWGVFTDELKAANPAMTDVFYGLEINLPSSASASQATGSTLKDRIYKDNSLDNAEKSFNAGRYREARRDLSTAMLRNGHTTARLAYMYAVSCEKTGNYMEALKQYGLTAELVQKGDRTLSENDLADILPAAERVLPLAQKEAEENERRKAEEEARARLRAEMRRREEAEKAERRRQRTERMLNALGQALNQTAAQMSGQMPFPAYSAPIPGFGTASAAPSMPFNPQLAAAGVTIPASLNPATWNPAAFTPTITYDSSGNPMVSYPGMANLLRQQAADVATMANNSPGANLGLSAKAQANLTGSEMTAKMMETPTYAEAITKEDVERARQQNREAHDELVASANGAKENIERIREYNRLKYGTGSVSTSTSSSSTSSTRRSSSSSAGSSSNTSSTNATGNSSPSHSKSSQSTAQTSLKTDKTDDNSDFDSHQQFKSGNKNVSSDDFTYIKTVDIYHKGNGKTMKKTHDNVKLYKKGSKHYVKIGDTYYMVMNQSYGGFSKTIVFGSSPYYFND